MYLISPSACILILTLLHILILTYMNDIQIILHMDHAHCNHPQAIMAVQVSHDMICPPFHERY